MNADPEFYKGKVVLFERGACDFTDKVSVCGDSAHIIVGSDSTLCFWVYIVCTAANLHLPLLT